MGLGKNMVAFELKTFLIQNHNGWSFADLQPDDERYRQFVQWLQRRVKRLGARLHCCRRIEPSDVDHVVGVIWERLCGRDHCFATIPEFLRFLTKSINGELRKEVERYSKTNSFDERSSHGREGEEYSSTLDGRGCKLIIGNSVAKTPIELAEADEQSRALWAAIESLSESHRSELLREFRPRCGSLVKADYARRYRARDAFKRRLPSWLISEMDAPA